MATSAKSGMVEDFNRGWKFNLGDVAAASAPGFDDTGWRGVKLPHDWSVELSFTTENTGGCTAFLPGGIGWYRKAFTVPESSRGKIIRIDFDGIYNNSDVWINGVHLGHRPYGYSPISYDLSKHLNYGDENTIAVKADRTAYMDSRWYPGSGIYRDVQLVTHDPVRVEQYGLFITTENNQQVTVRTTVVNGGDSGKTVAVKTDLQEADGKSAAFQILKVSLAAGETKEVRQRFELADPRLWDTGNPYLYTAEVELAADGVAVDRVAAAFGIRDIRYDADEGFFLNGKNTLIKGVCLHHDAGCVGAAVPDGVWERRLRILKQGGCNAIRTAHNPPSAAFLDLCDRLGFLVQDEAFDEWYNPKDKQKNYSQQDADERTRGYSESFGEWGERDIKAMVLRDRNHPSIIMWSIGNEIEWTYPGYGYATGYWNGPRQADYYWDLPPYSLEELKERYSEEEQGEHVLADQAADLARWIKEIDTSRPVTANLVMPSISHFSGYTDALDIIGYSYRTILNEWGHKHFPDKMIMGTENWVQWSEWKGVLDHPHVPGIFVWTGFSYLGETSEWPCRSNRSGMIDTAGFPEANYWLFKTFWKEDEPMVHIVTQPLQASSYRLEHGRVVENADNPRGRQWGWPALVNHWNYTPGEEVYIELYANTDEVELYLNGKSLGVRKLEECPDRLMKWAVPFEAGTLKAIGRTGGRKVAEQVLETAGEPAGIQLDVDKPRLEANGYDVVHCIVRLVDAKGIPVRHAERKVTFKVEGDARNIGVDNGSTTSVQDFQSDQCMTDEGGCLMVLQAGRKPGGLKVTASADGLEPAFFEFMQQ